MLPLNSGTVIVGRYVDEIDRNAGGLKFRSRLCVYDSEMVLNSLIYPI